MHSEEPKPNPSLEKLAGRLRALPEPEVPAGLESRLLAAVAGRVSTRSREMPVARQGWFAVACSVGAIAVVGLFAIFVTRQPEHSPVMQTTAVGSDPVPPRLPRAEESGGDPLSSVDNSMLLRGKLSTFRWPSGRIPSARDVHSIPRDLLD